LLLMLRFRQRLSDSRLGEAPEKRSRQGKEKREKEVARSLRGRFRLGVRGTVACQEALEKEIQEQVEEEIQEGQQQVEEQMREATQRIEQKAQRIEQEAREAQKQIEERVGEEQP
jgi:hypothetical protein